jgi:2'-5' RNA ligase
MKPLQYALVAYVRNSLGEFVENLRRELHPAHAHLPTHLSILPPRPLQGSESEAIELVESVCHTAEPFEVGLGGVETFMPITPTVFIRVEHAAYRMRELHDRLNRGVLNAVEQWPYMPHLTIFKMDDMAEAQTALGSAVQRWAGFRGPRRVLLDQLTFVREAGENRWVDLAPVPLGGRLAPARK